MRSGYPASSWATSRMAAVSGSRPDTPEEMRVHDFLDRQLGKAIPYGVYDVTANQGWVSVGIDHDTAAFAVASVRRWWEQMGRPTYPTATELLITADGGGSNSSHIRLWKTELQRLADETGLRISVCHFPPRTSKWNAIEHRLFCHITQNWRGRPLVSLEVVVNLISNTTTRAGLKVQAELDPRRTRLASRSATLTSRPCSSNLPPSTATGTTPLLHTRMIRLLFDGYFIDRGWPDPDY